MQRQRPRLRNGVDLQLQSAFHDGNWAVVVRLAEKRWRTFNDQYYEIVKICAESQLDDPTAKFAAVAAVQQYVKNGTVVKDVDGLDLLDWATQGLLHDDDFSETAGVLRVRAVKAAPKDKNGATRCLESCLLHWDLVNAQQIAAMIDRSFPQERSFMFWNIIITHMLSQSPQSSPEKKKLYGTLAQKQIERAAQPVEQSDAVKSPRTVQTEEEILLLYDIVETHGSDDDLKKLINNDQFSPVAQFRHGRKELLQRILAYHQRQSNWPAIFTLCKECLSVSDESEEPSLLASDAAIWKQFIGAASHLKDAKYQDTIRELLLKLKKTASSHVIHRRNLLLARVLAAFSLEVTEGDDLSEGVPSSLRMRELIHYIDDQSLSPSCFDDVKGFVGQLDASAIRFLAYDYLPGLGEDVDDALKSARLSLLSMKTQYFAWSCPVLRNAVSSTKSTKSEQISDPDLLDSPPAQETAKISASAIKLYTSILRSEKKGSRLYDEILPELSLVSAFCNIRLAFLPNQSNDSLLSTTSIRYLLRALLILEHQIFLSPGHSVVSLVLVQLNLLLGSAHRSRELWDPLAVKRTIMDSLAPIFYDRISTISPSVISPADSWGWNLVDMLKTHYSYSLRLRMPRQLIEAFEAGSYSSIMGMTKYMQNLRTSCTRAMSLVEEARTERLFGHPVGDVLDDARFNELSDDVDMNELVDFGSFPVWDSQSCKPLPLRLGLGPPPSNRRAHLSLLSEAFHDLLAYKPPPIYKASAAATNVEQMYVIETISQLSNSFSRFLVGSDKDLTAAEQLYFDAASLLTTLMVLAVDADRTTLASGEFGHLADAVKAALETLQLRIDQTAGDGVDKLVLRLSSLHDVTMFHDAAAATKLASQWILSHNEREKERDRSGQSSLPKDTVAHVKALQSAADAALKHGKAWAVKLREDGARSGFEQRLRQWVFDGEEKGEGGIGEVVEDETVSELVGSWRLNARGWQQVKWE